MKIPVNYGRFRRCTAARADEATGSQHHRCSFSTTPTGYSKRAAAPLVGSSCTLAPASNGNADSICERDVHLKWTWGKRTGAHTPSPTAFGWARPRHACLAFLSLQFSRSRAHAALAQNSLDSPSTQALQSEKLRARAPLLYSHDAHMVGRSRRRAHDAAARPHSAAARAQSGRPVPARAHFESSARNACVRVRSSSRGRLRPESAALRACNRPRAPSWIPGAQSAVGTEVRTRWFLQKIPED